MTQNSILAPRSLCSHFNSISYWNLSSSILDIMPLIKPQGLFLWDLLDHFLTGVSLFCWALRISPTSVLISSLAYGTHLDVYLLMRGEHIKRSLYEQGTAKKITPTMHP